MSVGSCARVLVLAAAAVVALSGCSSRPLGSQDSIYGNSEPSYDPAVRSPHLLPGPPGLAESPSQAPPPSANPTRAATGPDRPITSVDQPARPRLVQAWIDGQPATASLGAKTVRVESAVSRQPTLRFQMDRRMGQLRGATLQIFRVARGQPDIATGICISEPGDNSLLVPDRPIDLAAISALVAKAAASHSGQPGRINCVRIAPNRPEPVREILLDAGADYEIQFLVSGSRMVDSLAVRVRIAAPPSSQPDRPATAPANPDVVDPSHLPNGVVVPK